MNIVFLDRCTFSPEINITTPSFKHQWTEYDNTSVHEIPERIDNADIIVTNKVPFNHETIEAYAKHIKMIAVTATGYNIIDINACRENNIIVCNVPVYAIHTVSEHVFMMMLTLSRQLIAYRHDINNGKWQQSPMFCLMDHPITDLNGKTLGIIGGGMIGQNVANIARAFGMSVIFASARKNTPTKTQPDYVSLNELYRQSDVISLHCPLTEQTKDLLTLKEYQLMEKKPIIINTARGGIANEKDTVTALKKELISGIGFDCLTTEPPEDNNPLLSISDQHNVIITPHNAWASLSAMQTLWNEVISNIESFYKGNARNRVS